MSTPRDIINRRIQALITQQANEMRGSGMNPIDRNLAMLGFERENPGFLERANAFLGNVFGDPDTQATGNLEAGLSERDIGQFEALISGIADPTLRGVQSLAQLPGLLTSRDLPTDRAARFIERMRVGILEEGEQNALEGGLTPDQVAHVQLAGELVGFTAPIAASLKAARLITGVQGGTELTFARNFWVDTVAGAVYGSTLTPGETIADRAVNTSREAAMAGIGSLVLSGPLFALMGMRFTRAQRLSSEEKLEQLLRDMADGKLPMISENDAGIVARIMSEEGFLATSPEAQAFLNNLDMEEALIAGIRNLADTGVSMGYVRGIARNFAEVQPLIDRFRKNFPGLKFDAVKRPFGQRGEEAFDVYFGLRGLNNEQRRQLAREGRFAGNLIQKNGAFYIYRRMQNDRIIAETVTDRSVVTLKPEGVTDFLTGHEEFRLPTAGHALYTDFKGFLFGKMKEASAAGSGSLSETDLIRFIRQGQLNLDQGSERFFDASGAVVSPTEVGNLVDPPEVFAQTFMQTGTHGAGMLEPTPIRNVDDAFDLWMRERNFPVDALDVDIFRSAFARQLREDIWGMVPKDEMNRFIALRDQLTKELAERELPFSALAAEKGFYVEYAEDASVILRDINTGTRLQFPNEGAATRALIEVVRSDKDPMFDFITPGAHGMPGLTGAFDLSDGVHSFDVNIAPEEFLRFGPKFGATLTNRRDYLERMEQLSGIPLFNSGFALIDEGTLRMREAYEPIANKISKIWKGIGRNDRKAAAEYWSKIEDTNLSGPDLVRHARAAGISNRQLTAIQASRRLFEVAARDIGVERSRFISVYYNKGRPAAKVNGVVDWDQIMATDELAAKELGYMGTLLRSGDLPVLELDPEIVMHKYFRSLAYRQHVYDAEQNVRTMLNLKIKDLTPDQARAVLARAPASTTPDHFVFPDEVRGVLKEYISNFRGDLSPGFAAARRTTQRIFESLGIEADQRLFDEFHNALMTVQYGAGIGLRIALMNRNATQNLWTMYTRVGAKHSSASLQRAMTLDGYLEALDAGAIRSIEASIPQADAIFESWFTPDIVKGTGPLSSAVATVIRQAVRVGRMSSKAAQKFLVPYGSGDQINRGWAYHWQKLHTAEFLEQFKRGAIGWDEFVEEGLPFFGESVKRGFRERLDRFGDEAALRWIGKQAADEAHFIYGSAATPTWMQNPFGRFFSIFGQWPLWAKQLYISRMKNGTPQQISKFFARTGLMIGALANVGLQTGVNMWSWYAPLSLNYSGGPGVDMMITARDIWSKPYDQKITATKRLAQQLGSMTVPGMLFYRETAMALDANNPAQAGLLLTLGRPADFDHYYYDFILDPAQPNYQSPTPYPQIPSFRGVPLDSVASLLRQPSDRQSASLSLRVSRPAR